MKKFIKNNWVLLTIIILGLFFRYWQIGHLPGGLFPDEAANGLDINSIFKGDLQPFYERGNGREALFFYVIAIVVSIFGRGEWQHHVVSAAFGIGSVIAMYFLTKRMFGKNTALIATFLTAVSSYAVLISRTAFRANTVPLMATLTLFFLVKFFQEEDKKTKYWSAAFAGLFFALGFYTYISFRMMLPLLFGFGFLLFFANRTDWKEVVRVYTKYKLTFIAGFAVGISWIAHYFITHPGSFVGRAGHVSIFNKDLNNGDVLGTFILVVKKTLLSFFTEGDLNWRHNVSGHSFLSPFVSPFFAGGLILFTVAIFIMLKQVWEQKLKAETVYMALCAYWFWFMIVPEITTAEGIPHGLRLIGVIPVIFIMAAWTMNWLWERLAGKTLTLEKKYFVIVFFSAIGIYNFYLYFGVAAASSDYYYAFRSDLTTVSEYLNQRDLKDRTYLSLDTFSVQTVDYLTTETNNPYKLVDPAHTFELKLKKGDQVVFTMSTLFDRLKFLETHKNVRLVGQHYNKFGQIIMLIYEQE